MILYMLPIEHPLNTRTYHTFLTALHEPEVHLIESEKWRERLIINLGG